MRREEKDKMESGRGRGERKGNLVPKDGESTIAHSTSRNTLIPICLFSLELLYLLD
jgi:hypothetical protein